VTETAVEFIEPSRPSPPRGYEVIEAPVLERWQQRDTQANTVAVHWIQPLARVRFANIEREFGHSSRGSHEITLEDPNSAVSKFEYTLHFRSGRSNVSVVGRSKLTSTSDTYNPVVTLEVREDDDIVFERVWDRVLDRAYS